MPQNYDPELVALVSGAREAEKFLNELVDQDAGDDEVLDRASELLEKLSSALEPYDG